MAGAGTDGIGETCPGGKGVRGRGRRRRGIFPRARWFHLRGMRS